MLSLLPRDRLAESLATPTSTAVQACSTCRKQKRKCDKLLPSCSRCASLQRICDYADSGPAVVPTAEDFAALQRKLNDLEGRLNSRIEKQSSAMVNAYDASGIGNWESNFGNHENTPAWTNRFPSVLFLDMDVYKYANTIPPKPEVDVPQDVFDALSSSEVIQEAVSIYFKTIHNWFPFISRKRMNLGISLVGGGPDLTLLLIAIKLITTTPPTSQSADRIPLYWTTKHFLQRLEVAGAASILYLQSLILIALYEYSHALYPSAYLSVGTCVRYASFLGLPSYAEASAVLGPCKTWTETEERRRTWWAVHILDRIISLGSKRPFAGSPVPSLSSPPSTDFLPTDDDAVWDAGDITRALQRPLSTPIAEPTNSPFARLAQAAVLISKAMGHCHRATTRALWNGSHEYERERSSGAVGEKSKLGDALGDDIDMEIVDDDDDDGKIRRPTTKMREVTAIIGELDALCKACQHDMTRAGAGAGDDAYFGFLTAQCLSWSTAIMVLDLYSCPEHMRPGGGGGGGGGENTGPPAQREEAEALALQVEAINGLRTASLHVRDEARRLLSIVVESESETGVDTQSPPKVHMEMVGKFSPLCLDAIYCGMSTFGWLWRENGDPEMKEGLDVMRQCLERLGTRWRLADEYLQMGKKQDDFMMEIMELNGTA